MPLETATAFQTLLCDIAAPVATITLNRPKVLNAINALAFDEIESVITQLAADPTVRVILLTGAGERAFAAGADINEIAATDATTGETLSRRGQSVFRLIETCGKPVLALINGFALGGGCELALACTLRIASERARLGQPEIKLGLIPGYGGSQRLPRLIGVPSALKLLLTGDMVDAHEALRLGLVDDVVLHDRLLARGHELAQTIATVAPLAVSGCLEAVHEGAALDIDAACALEARIFGHLCASEDKREGTTAFLEKRPPIWTSR